MHRNLLRWIRGRREERRRRVRGRRLERLRGRRRARLGELRRDRLRGDRQRRRNHLSRLLRRIQRGDPAAGTSSTSTSASTAATTSPRTSPRCRLEPLGPGRLGRLSIPDLPSRQGSLRPHWDLGAWRRTVGHEGGLEHVEGPSALGAGRDREVSITTRRRDNGLVKRNRSRRPVPRDAEIPARLGCRPPRHPHRSADAASATRPQESATRRAAHR